MDIPPLGPRIPKRGNAFSRWLGRTVLGLMGWKLEGTFPDVPKMVVIGAPHTSNMDGVIGISAMVALGLRAGTMIKDSAFKGPLGSLLRWLGAIPIDRSSSKGVVEQSIDAFKRSEQLWLLLTPEGTRKGAPTWKHGFHHIALGAQVSILPAAADYRSKTITVGSPLAPGSDYDADQRRLVAFFKECGFPRHPERLSGPLRETGT